MFNPTNASLTTPDFSAGGLPYNPVVYPGVSAPTVSDANNPEYCEPNLQPKAPVGKYVARQQGTFVMTEKALINPGQDLESRGIYVVGGLMRDISQGIATSNPTALRDFGFDYSDPKDPNSDADLDRTTMLPVDDIIVDYKPNVGVQRDRTNANGSFNSTYGGTYVYLGIRSETYDSIARGIAAFESTCNAKLQVDTENAVTEDQGYKWVIARFPNRTADFKVTISVPGAGGQATLNEIGTIPDVLKTLRQSLKGIGVLAFRTSYGIRAGCLQSPGRVTVTLHGFQLIDYSDLHRPDRNAPVRTAITNRVAETRLINMLTSINNTANHKPQANMPPNFMSQAAGHPPHHVVPGQHQLQQGQYLQYGQQQQYPQQYQQYAPAVYGGATQQHPTQGQASGVNSQLQQSTEHAQALSQTSPITSVPHTPTMTSANVGDNQTHTDADTAYGSSAITTGQH